MTCTSIKCNEYRMSYDGHIDTSRSKRAVGIQYKHESKEDITGFIPKPVARPEYGMILVGTLQRIHRQYIRYKLALDDTLIGIENRNLGYLTHHILDPQILGKYLEAAEDDLEETAPEFEPVFTSVYQYYGNSLISFTNTIDDLLLQLPILIKLKVQVPISLFSIETAPVPLDAETYIEEKREYT